MTNWNDYSVVGQVLQAERAWVSSRTQTQVCVLHENLNSGATIHEFVPQSRSREGARPTSEARTSNSPLPCGRAQQGVRSSLRYGSACSAPSAFPAAGIRFIIAIGLSGTNSIQLPLDEREATQHE